MTSPGRAGEAADGLDCVPGIVFRVAQAVARAWLSIATGHVQFVQLVRFQRFQPLDAGLQGAAGFQLLKNQRIAFLLLLCFEVPCVLFVTLFDFAVFARNPVKQGANAGIEIVPPCLLLVLPV